MRKFSGLAIAAVLATAVVGVQSGSATGQAVRSPARPRQPSRRSRTTRVLARATTGQKFVVTDTIVDRDGTTHVRMDRRYQGLRVVGGDLVVHTAPSGSLEGVSQTLAEPVRVAHHAEGDLRRCHEARAGAGRRDREDREPAGDRGADPGGRRHHGQASPGLGGTQRWTPRRRDAQPAVDVRRRLDRQGDPPRGAHPDRRGVRPDPLQRDGAAAAHAVGLDVPAQGPDPRQHVHHRHEQRRGLAPLPDLRQRLQDRHPVHQLRPRRSATAPRATARPPRPTRSTAPT